MPRPAKSTREAVARAASVADARVAAGARGPAGSIGPGDPLVGELRRSGLLPLLVLHFTAQAPCYGNQLMERISQLTGGTVAVNPNTMYPLLRSLEARGLIAGEWESPDRRSRRFYRITEAGETERERLAAALAPRLDAVAASVESVRRELFSPK